MSRWVYELIDAFVLYRLYEDGSRKGSVIIQGLEEVQVRDKREVFKILEKVLIRLFLDTFAAMKASLFAEKFNFGKNFERIKKF